MKRLFVLLNIASLVFNSLLLGINIDRGDMQLALANSTCMLVNTAAIVALLYWAD